jgi:hypothetical protein
MTNDSHDDLLDDLYPAAGAGPDCDAVLGMVRQNRAVKRRRRAATALGLLAVFWGAAWMLRDTAPQSMAPTVVQSQVREMPRISDDELLEIVGGQSAAIATLPDGSQRLLVIVQGGLTYLATPE